MSDDDRKYPETKRVPSVAKNSAMFIMFRLGFMDGFAKTLRTTFSSFGLRSGRSSRASRRFISLRNASFESSRHRT